MKMKLKDFDLNVMAKEQEVDRIHEILGDLKPYSEEYTTARENLAGLEEAKYSTIRAKNEYVNGKFPEWARWAVGLVASLGVFGAVRAVEKNDGVFSSQGTNVWEKVSRLFMR